MPSTTRHLISLVAAALLVPVLSCGSHEETERKLQEATSRLQMCEQNTATARNDVQECRKKLVELAAQAPEKMVLNDPEIINLIADVRAARRAASSTATTAGGKELDPAQASKIILNGAGAMQQCYERALKKNAALQMQAGVAIKLHVLVKPTGGVDSVNLVPDVDRGMSECIRATATHWKFPTFSGTPVEIEQRVTLTPKT